MSSAFTLMCWRGVWEPLGGVAGPLSEAAASSFPLLRHTALSQCLEAFARAAAGSSHSAGQTHPLKLALSGPASQAAW